MSGKGFFVIFSIFFVFSLEKLHKGKRQKKLYETQKGKVSDSEGEIKPCQKKSVKAATHRKKK